METFENYNRPWNMRCCDYSFISTYMWSDENSPMIAEQDGFLFMRYTGEDGTGFFMAPVPSSPDLDYVKGIELAAQQMKSDGMPLTFCYIPQLFIKHFMSSPYNLSVVHDRDHDDYIYLTENLANLTGKKYHSKKNHINSFIRNNPDWKYVRLGSSGRNQCMELYDKWRASSGPAIMDGVDERVAVEKCFDNLDTFGLICSGITAGGELIAFSIGELSGDTMTIHIEKAIGDPGAFAMINREFALNECLGKTEFINREDDMGMEGLRNAKLSYHPFIIAEKYCAFIR